MADDRRVLAAQAKHNASKYDFVKVKVWLGDGMTHYYILSRFLISRVLTVTKIPYMKAVKISLEVKKHLIDNNKFEVSQADLEEILFKIMDSKGFGAEYIQCYKMVNQFHQERRPLIVVVCGAPCTGKSSLAQQLASRFNMPNVLQTDLFYELLRSSEDMPMSNKPLWERSDLDENQLVAEFQRECQVVRRSIDGDLVKTIRDGKSIIIEGLHLDPGLYLYEFGKYGIRHLHSRADSLLPQQSLAPHDDALLLEPGNPEPLNPDRSIQEAAALQPAEATARQLSEQQAGEDADMHGNWQQVSSSTILNSTREVLHNRLSNETVPGTKLLFALASVADKLSPVLSNTVSAFYKAGKHDSVADHNAMAQQPAKAEYFTQQLHKVYHGLANTCKVSSDAAQPSNMPEQPTGHGHTQAGEGTSDCQHAVATSQHAQHQQQDAQRQPEQQQQQHLHNRRGGDEGQSQHQQPNQAGITSDEATTQVELAQVDTCSSAKVQPRVPAAVATEGNDAAAPHQTNHADKDNEQDQAKNELDEPEVKQKRKDDKGSATPVFVPIVVAMDQKDHKVMVEEWYSRQMAVSGQMNDAGPTDKEMTAAADATYKRLQLLQDHLCSYADRNVPVVTLDLANFSDTMEQLHDYLLQCIQSAMQ